MVDAPLGRVADAGHPVHRRLSGRSPTPMISVILPVLRSEGLERQLQALSEQTYRGPWELVIADNSPDQRNRPIARAWEGRLPSILVVDASARRGGGPARNLGVRAARGDRLAFCDADDAVHPEWLETLAVALAAHPWVAGALHYGSVNGDADARERARPQRTGLPVGLGFKPYVATANMAIERVTFERVGGFPEDLSTGEDKDLSWRLQLAGFDARFEPRAIVQNAERHGVRKLWKKHVAYGRSHVRLFKRYRRYGLMRPPMVASLRPYARLVLDARHLLRSREREEWIRRAGTRWGRIVGSLANRCIYL
jgi:GT2 family glycosyltransferase